MPSVRGANACNVHIGISTTRAVTTRQKPTGSARPATHTVANHAAAIAGYHPKTANARSTPHHTSRHSRSGSQCTSTLARSGVRRSASRRSAIRRSALRRSTHRRSTLRRSIYSSETAAPYRFMRRTRSNPQRISRIHSRTRRPLAAWTMSLLQKPKHLPDMPLVQPARRLKTQSAKR